MVMIEPVFVHSRDNSLVKELRKLAGDNLAYRKLGRYWVEGDHLCRAAILRGKKPDLAVFTESSWSKVDPMMLGSTTKNVVLADSLFHSISNLDSPASMGFVFTLPEAASIDPNVATVILDRVQDAGNVGSILRSAAAFGFHQVLALQGTAALWSSKALRAGMGAHFGLALVENLGLTDLENLAVPMVVTSSHQGSLIQNQKFPRPCAWVFGHEGQGVAHQLTDLAKMTVCIGQPGGEESLNVAAAAAICLHFSSL